MPDWTTLDSSALGLTFAALILTLGARLGVGWLILLFAAAGLVRAVLA